MDVRLAVSFAYSLPRWSYCTQAKWDDPTRRPVQSESDDLNVMVPDVQYPPEQCAASRIFVYSRGVQGQIHGTLNESDH